MQKLLQKKVLTEATLGSAVKNAEYAVRGRIAIRADQLKHDLINNKKLPFEKIIACNIGNPQALGQKPISFSREVISLVTNPILVDKPNVGTLFSKDSIERAKHYLSLIECGAVGAYSESKGYYFVRDNVKSFIDKRDGVNSDREDIHLTNGASNGVEIILKILIRDKNDAIMIPIPQYPLYSAQITLNGGAQVGYYLDESTNWGLNLKDLEESYNIGKEKGLNQRAIVVINPGNPTGQVLKKSNIEDIINFSYKNKLVILADEVYQENIYDKNSEFHSFRKILSQMGKPISEEVELISFHSISKGFTGECGLRGGYYELVNIDEYVKEQAYKLKSISLCPSTIGQLGVDLLVNPPTEGKNSPEIVKQYQGERDHILSSLKERAELITERLNKMKNIKCNPIQGAMYAFPRIFLSDKAIKAAKEKNMQPDLFYCSEVLENTGIVIVPGSGFGQREGTYHFRTTNLPYPVSEMKKTLEIFGKFNDEFHAKYE